MSSRLTRRRALQVGGGVVLGATAGAAAATAAASASSGSGPEAPDLPFDAPAEQQGIATPRQRHLALAAFTLAPELRGAFGRSEIAGLMQDWSAAARRLTAGDRLAVGAGPVAAVGAPADSGSAHGLAAAGLTLTFGVGGAVFDAGRDLVPVAAHPRGFPSPMPRFAGEALQERWSGGDLLVSAAADDPQVAVHAVHALARIAAGAAALHWVQRGFLPASGSETPRNLMGFKDGTATLEGAATGTQQRYLWAGREQPAWLHGGGTFVVVRRIRMLLEGWDRATLEKQEDTIGRTKAEGAPLGQQQEDDPVDLARLQTTGEYAVPERSHVAIAHRAAAAGATIHRRPYSYADGVDPATGQLDAGLVFLSFQRSVERQFVPLQRALAATDALNEYTQAIGSAVFAVPPASRDARDWVGRTLLAPR